MKGSEATPFTALKKHLQTQLTRAIAMAGFLCVLTSCMEPARYVTTFTLTTPANGTVLAAIPTIEGGYHEELENLVSLRLYIIRYSDGKYWNGLSWGGVGQVNLPTTFNDTSANDGVWSSTGAMPAGANLPDGYYAIRAIGRFEDNQNHVREKEADSVVAVGVTVVPSTSTPLAWGENSAGKLGSGTGPNANELKPVFMRGALEGKNVVAMSVGAEHTLALTSEHRVYAWGSNSFGQLGRGEGNTTDSDVPVEVDLGWAGNHQFTRIVAGDYHSVAMNTAGQLYVWGRNHKGQLGTGAASNIPVTKPVLLDLFTMLGSTESAVEDVAAGSGFTVMVSRSHDLLFAWGNNSNGQLGDGTTNDSPVPVAVQGVNGLQFERVESGAMHTLALTLDGKVYAFGSNLDGALGNGTTTATTTPVLAGVSGPMAGKKIVRIQGGYAHSLALGENGKVYAWGKGTEGALGDGGTTSQTTPLEVGGALQNLFIKRIGAGRAFSAAVTSDGQFFTWGDNAFGTLAGATPFAQTALVPTAVNDARNPGDDILGLATGYQHGALITGFPPLPNPDISVEPVVNGSQGAIAEGATLDVGTHAIGTNNPTYIVIRNMGNAELCDLGMSIDGANASDFYGVFNSPPVAPNGITGFYVFFAPTSLASPATPDVRTATLHITSNDPDTSPFDIVLQGTAVAPGKVDPGFNTAANNYAYAFAQQPDGKLVVGGEFTTLQPAGAPSPVTRNRIARLNADGTLDAFDPNASFSVNAVVVLPDGKLLVGGNFGTLGGSAPGFLVRLNADGTRDATFDPQVDAVVHSLAVQPDGKILVAGTFSNVGGQPHASIARLNADGTVEAAFNPNPTSVLKTVYSVLVQSDGKIVIGGSFRALQPTGAASPTTRNRIARLNADGTLDTGYDPNIGGNVYALALQRDGKIIVGGSYSTVGSPATGVNALARLNDDGTLDGGFNALMTGGYVQTIALQADAKILIGGIFSNAGGNPHSNTARLNASGTSDESFVANNFGTDGIAIQADGKVLLGGVLTDVNGTVRSRLARVLNGKATQTLSVPYSGRVEWLRGGTSPEADRVTFDLSTDSGATWTALGAGTRITGGWEITGLALPSDGIVRARATVRGGRYTGCYGLVESQVVFGTPPPDIEVTDVTGFSTSIPVSTGHTHDFGVFRPEDMYRVYSVKNTGLGTLTGLGGITLDGPGAAAFQLSFYGHINTALANGAGNLVRVDFRPKTAGDHSATLHITSNDPDESQIDIHFTGLRGELITTWKQRYFGETTNTGTGADDADPDGDGRTNLEEYAQGFNPKFNESASTFSSFTASTSGGGKSSASNGDLASELSGDTFLYTYPRNKLALADVIFQVEWSDTMAPADWHTDDVTEQVLSEDNNIQQVQASVPAGTTGRRFVRLKMTRP